MRRVLFFLFFFLSWVIGCFFMDVWLLHYHELRYCLLGKCPKNLSVLTLLSYWNHQLVAQVCRAAVVELKNGEALREPTAQPHIYFIHSFFSPFCFWRYTPPDVFASSPARICVWREVCLLMRTQCVQQTSARVRACGSVRVCVWGHLLLCPSISVPLWVCMNAQEHVYLL